MIKFKKLISITFISLFAVGYVGTSSLCFADDVKPKYGPPSAPIAAPLALSHDYFAKHPSPDFWALIGYYVPQMNEYSCSAASVSMVINAARARLPKTADDKLISQKMLLETVDVEQWKQRLSSEGVVGSHGTSLARLGKIVEAVFKAYGFPKVAVHVVSTLDKSAETKKSLHKALVENEKSQKDFMIANFDQKSFTDDTQAGHIAPVGAYDAEKRRVLILDPDREYYEPYWVSEDAFLDGMATLDKGANSNRGYLVVKVDGEK